MCNWFRKPKPPTPPAPVVLFKRDFTNSQFSWSDWFAFAGKGMRGIYPDFMQRCIWVRENVIPSKEGLILRATTTETWGNDWQSDGYYTRDWFTGKFNLCGQICSYNTGLKQGVTLKPGNRLDVVAKLSPLGYTYFDACPWMYRAEPGDQLPEFDFEKFGYPAFPYMIGGPSNYLKFSLHRNGVPSVSTGHVFPVLLNEGFHTYSFIYGVGYAAWLVDSKEMFRVTENVPTCELLFIIGIQSGGEPGYSHVFSKEEEGGEMVVQSVTITKI